MINEKKHDKLEKRNNKIVIREEVGKIAEEFAPQASEIINLPNRRENGEPPSKLRFRGPLGLFLDALASPDSIFKASNVNGLVDKILNSRMDRDEKERVNIEIIALLQAEKIINFHRVVLRQAQQSFLTALIASIIGLLFFIAALTFLLLAKPQSIASVSLISGALVEVIAGLNFYLYGKQQSQFATFHRRLDRTQNLLLAHNVCKSVEDATQRDTTIAKLGLLIASSSQTLAADPNEQQKQS